MSLNEVSTNLKPRIFGSALLPATKLTALSPGTKRPPVSEWLIRTPEFTNMSIQARQALFSISIRRCYRKGEIIYLQDDDAENFYIIISGHVRVSYLMEDGSSVLCAVLPSGQSFGELGVFEAGRHCDMVTAIDDVMVALIPARTMRALGARHSELDLALARLVARRYRCYVELTRALSLKSLPARLAQAILRLASSLGTRTIYAGREVSCIGSMITQSDLGMMARGARGNVNRTLKAWERAGWIAMPARTILVLDGTRLEQLSAEEKTDG